MKTPPKSKLDPDLIGGKQEAKEQAPSLAEYDDDPRAHRRLRREAERDLDSLFDDPEKL